MIVYNIFKVSCTNIVQQKQLFAARVFKPCCQPVTELKPSSEKYVWLHPQRATLRIRHKKCVSPWKNARVVYISLTWQTSHWDGGEITCQHVTLPAYNFGVYVSITPCFYVHNLQNYTRTWFLFDLSKIRKPLNWTSKHFYTFYLTNGQIISWISYITLVN